MAAAAVGKENIDFKVPLPRGQRTRERRYSWESNSTNKSIRSDASSVRRQKAVGARTSSREAARRKERAREAERHRDVVRGDQESRASPNSVLLDDNGRGSYRGEAPDALTLEDLGTARRHQNDSYTYEYDYISESADLQRTVEPMTLYEPHHEDAAEEVTPAPRRYEYEEADERDAAVYGEAEPAPYGGYHLSDDDPDELDFADEGPIGAQASTAPQYPAGEPTGGEREEEDGGLPPLRRRNVADQGYYAGPDEWDEPVVLDDVERVIDPKNVQLPRVHNAPDRFEFVSRLYGGKAAEELPHAVKLYEEGMQRKREKERLIEQALEEESPVKQSQFTPRISRYARSIQWEEDVVTRLNRPTQRTVKIPVSYEEEEKECTFAPDPKLLASSKRLLGSSREDPTLDRFSSLLLSFNSHEAKRAERLGALIQEKQEREAAPFRPQILPKSASLRRKGNVHDRLYQQGKKHLRNRDKRAEERKEEELDMQCTGIPETHDFHLEEYKRPAARDRNIHTALYNDVWVQRQSKMRTEIAAMHQQQHLRNRSKMSGQSEVLVERRMVRRVAELFEDLDVEGAGGLDANQVASLLREIGVFVPLTEHNRQRVQEEAAMLQRVWTQMDAEDSGFVIEDDLIRFMTRFLEMDKKLRQEGRARGGERLLESAGTCMDMDSAFSDLSSITGADNRSGLSTGESLESKSLRRFVRFARTAMAYDPSFVLRRQTEWEPDSSKYTFKPKIDPNTDQLEAKATSELLATGSTGDRVKDRTDLMMLRAKLAERKKEVKRLHVMEEREKECTFQPVINEHSDQLMRELTEVSPELRDAALAAGKPGRVVGMPLYSEAQLRKSAREREEREQKKHKDGSTAEGDDGHTFHPVINPPPELDQAPPPPRGYEETIERLRTARKEKEELDRLLAPPHLEGNSAPPPETKTSPKRPRPAEATARAEDPILFFMDVNLGMGRYGRIGVRGGDDPAMLADAFGQQYELDPAMVVGLESLIEDRIESFHAQLEEGAEPDEDPALMNMDAEVEEADRSYHHNEVTRAAVDLVSEISNDTSASEDIGDITDGPPRVSIKISGPCREGCMLIATERYTGGVEGESQRQWVRIKSTGRREIVAHGERTYLLTGADAGATIVYQCRPVRNDGVTGRWTATPPSKLIDSAPPMITSLSIAGVLVEGKTVRAVASYVGGVEGTSLVRWHRCDPVTHSGVLAGEGPKYSLSSADVGSCLRVEYIPKRIDGLEGALATVTTEPVGPALPKATDMRFLPPPGSEVALFEWGTPLQPDGIAVFGGGPAGVQQYQWFRVIPGPSKREEDATFQEIGTCRDYAPTQEDVGKHLKFVWTPVSQDGRRGNPVSLTTPVPIQLTATS